jgi:hypothetical protein
VFDGVFITAQSRIVHLDGVGLITLQRKKIPLTT